MTHSYITDEEKRLPTMTEKEKVYQYLQTQNISHTKIEHRALYTIDDILEAGIDHADLIAKNLFLRNDSGKQHYLVTICSEKNADLKDVRRQLGSSRLSFASEERLLNCFGVHKGSVSPLGVLNDTQAHVVVALDEDLLKQPQIGIHPNDNTATLFLSPQDLIEIIRKNGNQVVFLKV